MKRVTTVSFVLLLAAMMSASVAAAPAKVRPVKPPATRPAELKAVLRAVLDVERQSQAYYRAVLNKHRPLHPFGIVYRMERDHEAALLKEFAHRGIATPEDRWQGKDIDVPDDRADALKGAAELEQKTIGAYEKAIAKASGDLKRTLERLRAESRDHQKWFEDPESCPRGGGGRGRGGPGRGPS